MPNQENDYIVFTGLNDRKTNRGQETSRTIELES